MGLPVLTVPTFDVTVPSINKKIKCRPFLVKEEKILLLSLNSEDENEIYNAVKQIINNCIVDKQNIDIEDLAIFDLEYILLKLRARSKGEAVRLKFNGIAESECEECRKEKYVTINLSNVEIKKFPNHTNNIKLTDDIGIIMGYPKFKTLQTNISRESDIGTIIDSVIECIEKIYDKDNVYSKKDLTVQELNEFVESLQSTQFDKLYEFISTMPRIEYELDLSCEKCGRKDVQTISGLQNFFL